MLSLKVCLNVNKMFPKDTLEKGQYNMLDRKTDNIIKNNKSLICTDMNIKLKVGDKVYYWMAAEDYYVVRYVKEDQSFLVVKDAIGKLIAKNTTLQDFGSRDEEC